MLPRPALRFPLQIGKQHQLTQFKEPKYGSIYLPIPDYLVMLKYEKRNTLCVLLHSGVNEANNDLIFQTQQERI